MPTEHAQADIFLFHHQTITTTAVLSMEEDPIRPSTLLSVISGMWCLYITMTVFVYGNIIISSANRVCNFTAIRKTIIIHSYSIAITLTPISLPCTPDITSPSIITLRADALLSHSHPYILVA